MTATHMLALWVLKIPLSLITVQAVHRPSQDGRVDVTCVSKQRCWPRRLSGPATYSTRKHRWYRPGTDILLLQYMSFIRPDWCLDLDNQPASKLWNLTTLAAWYQMNPLLVVWAHRVRLVQMRTVVVSSLEVFHLIILQMRAVSTDCQSH